MGQALAEPVKGGRYRLFLDRPEPMLGRVLIWEPPGGTSCPDASPALGRRSK
jgi:hypothetical protein